MGALTASIQFQQTNNNFLLQFAKKYAIVGARDKFLSREQK